MHHSLSALCKPNHEVVLRDRTGRIIFSWTFGGVRLESPEGVSLELPESSPIMFDVLDPHRVEVIIQLPPHVTAHDVATVEVQDETGVWYGCHMDPPPACDESTAIVLPFRADNLPVEKKRKRNAPRSH